MTTNPHVPQKPPSLQEQVAEVYALVDELQIVENRLRAAVTTTLATLKGESPT